MYRIRRAEPRDHVTVLERVLASFCEGNPVHPDFESLYPDTIRSDAESMAQWLIAEVDGEVAAGMQIVPRPLVVAASVSLEASGLGNVFCYPPYRRRGLMTALLSEAIQEMQRRHFVLSMLGGERLRYGRMGWEHAGEIRRLTLSSGMYRFRENDQVGVLELCRWDGDSTVLGRMHEAYSVLPYRSCRSLEEMAEVMRRPGQSVWVWDPTGGEFAYLSLKGNSLVEYAGAVAGLEKLLRFVLRSRNVDVNVPPVEKETERERLLLSLAQSFVVAPVAMVRVIDLAGLLRAYRPILSERLGEWNGVQTLQIAGSDSGVCVCSHQGECRILEEVRGEPLILGMAEMSRLMFGPFPPSGLPKESGPFRRLAFPLPLYWHDLGHV